MTLKIKFAIPFLVSIIGIFIVLLFIINNGNRSSDYILKREPAFLFVIAASIPHSAIVALELWNWFYTKIVNKSNYSLQDITQSVKDDKIFLKSIPLLVIFVTNSVLLNTLNDSPRQVCLFFGIVACEMIFASQALLHADFIIIVSSHSASAHSFYYSILNTTGMILLCFSELFHSLQMSAIGVCIHGALILSQSVVRSGLMLRPSEGDEDEDPICTDFTGRIRLYPYSPSGSFTWQFVTYSIFIITAWCIQLTNVQPNQYHRDNVINANLYLLSFVSIAVTVFCDRSLHEKLTVSKLAADMNMDFVRYISHELRSQVGHLALGLQMLGEDAKGTQTSAAIQDLQDSCDSAIQILNDLVIFDNLRMVQKTSSLRCEKSFEQVDEILRNSIDEKHRQSVR